MMTTSAHAHTLACAECDLLVQVQPLAPGELANCPRCGHRLTRAGTDPLNRALALGIAAAILAVTSISFDFLSFSSRGQSHTMTLFQSASWFFVEDRPLLGSVIALTLFLIPAAYLMGAIYILLSLKQHGRPMGGPMVLRWTMAAKPWVLTDVFMVGVLVSMVKVMDLADVIFGPSFWAFILFCFVLCAMSARMDPHHLWDALEEKSP